MPGAEPRSASSHQQIPRNLNIVTNDDDSKSNVSCCL